MTKKTKKAIDDRMVAVAYELLRDCGFSKIRAFDIAMEAQRGNRYAMAACAIVFKNAAVKEKISQEKKP